MKVQKMHYSSRNDFAIPIDYFSSVTLILKRPNIKFSSFKYLLCSLIFTLFLFAKTSFGQERLITGTVTSLNGEPLSGATITVKGTRTSVKTNISGAFIISVPPKSNILIASFVEHQTKEVTLSGNGIINIVLRSLT